MALARALISSAADEERLAREAMADTLLLRVQAYVPQSTSATQALTPDAIAAAHHVSVRQLYKTFASSGLSLEQWIIALRLEGARGTWRGRTAASARSLPWDGAGGSRTRRTSPSASGRRTA